MRTDIQILRGISVLSVVFYHFDKEIFSKGYLGVDIFFLISGFLITGKILTDLENNLFSFKNFYIKRTKRILPSLISTSFLTIAIGLFNLTAEQFSDLIRGIKYSLFFISNIFFSQSIDYFSLDSERNLIINLWSLSIEEQFYLLYPIFLFSIFRYARKYLVKILIISILISIGFYSEAIFSFFNLKLLFFNYENYIFYSPFTRAWQLLLGGLIYLLSIKIKIFIDTRLLLLLILILVCSNYDYKLNFLLFLATSFVLISNYNLNLNFINKGFFHLGNISYSIYLIHQPVLAGIRNHNFFSTPGSSKFIETNSFRNLLIISFVIYFLSIANYFFIEKKFRGKNSFEHKTNIFLSIFFIFFIVLIFAPFNIYSFAYPEFELNQNISFPKKIGTNYLLGNDNKLCISRDSIEKACKFGTGSSKLYFLGDSTVASLLSGFASEEILNRKIIIDYTQAGCFPIIGLCNFQKSSQYFNDVMNITNSTIIIGGAINHMQLNDSVLIETFNKILENDNKILFLGYVPKSPVDEVMYFRKNKRYYIDDNVDFFNQQLLINQSYVDKFIYIEKELATTNFEYVEVFDLFCKQNECKFYDDENLFFFTDYVHLSHEGAKHIFENSKFSQLLREE